MYASLTFNYLRTFRHYGVLLNQNKSYDDSVKLQRTEMDPFRLGNEAERARERAREKARESLSLTILNID